MAEKEEVAPRDFASTLLDLPGAHKELGEVMQKLISAVKETGKAGTVTLKIGVKLLPGNDNAIIITPTVTPALPKMDLKAGVFYADRNNNPVRNDPNQPGLFAEDDLRDAPAHDATTGEIKELSE